MSSRWSPRSASKRPAQRATRVRAACSETGSRRERPGRHRSALQWPAELREWRLHLWFGGHGGQGARGARVAAQAATVGRAATPPARGRRLCLAAARRRRHRHGRAWRRRGAGPARADGRAGRDRDAQVRGLRAPQVPDLLRLRDRTRRRPADLRRSGRGQPAHRLPVDAGVRRSPVCVGSARLPKRVRDRIRRPPRSDRCPRLAHRRAP